MAALVVGAGGCSRSTSEIQRSVDDLDGVTRVRVDERETGMEGFPSTYTHDVKVSMAEDATADDVMAVFDELSEAIDDGDVASVDVVLARKTATLSSGEGMHPTTEMVEDLIDAQHDDSVVAYRREDYPVLPNVDVTLHDASFADVVAYADRYEDDGSLELVTVSSGGFLLDRDAANEDQSVTDARQHLVEQALERFALRGAYVAGRGPLELYVVKADEAAVTAWADRRADSTVRSVVVRTRSPRYVT